MKLKEIQRYKPLDITEISASTWNTAEKVLGLDSGDTVVMVETEEDEDYKEYVDDAIASALTEYYDKDEVDDLIASVDVSDQLVDYAKSSAVTQEINAAIAAETARTESTYLKEHQDLSNYALTSSVTQDIQTAMASETARTEATYAKIGDIPSLDGYATENYVDAAITAGTQDMATKAWVGNQGYAVSTAVTQDINTAIANETARTENTYAKPSDIPSLENYYTKNQTDAQITAATEDMATKTWVGQQGYLTEHQSLDGLFDSVTYVSSSKTINFYDKSETLVGTIDATDFIKDGMVDNVYITGGTLVISFNTDAGQEDISISLTDIFNPANYYDKNAIDGLFASETARTDSTYIKIANADLIVVAMGVSSGGIQGEPPNYTIQYVRKDAETGDALTGQLYIKSINGDPIISSAQFSVEERDLSLPTFNDVSTAITSAMASETARTESTYLKEHQDISGKLDTSVFTGYTGSTATEIASKLDTTAFTQAMANETARTESTYAKPSDIPSLSGYATEAYVTAATQDMATKTWVGEQGFVVSSAVTADINTAIAAETARTENAYVKSSNLPYPIVDAVSAADDGLSDFLNVEYINPSDGESQFLPVYVKRINGTGIISNEEFSANEKSITLPTFNDVSTAITASMASETARTEETYAKIADVPSLDGYWTSAQTNNAITAATEDMATKTWVGQQGYLTQHQDISGKLDTSVFTGYTGSTQEVLSGKLDTSVYSAYTGTTETALGGKLGVDVFTGYTGATNTVIAGKLDTTAFTDAMASETARTESTYLKEHQDISGKLDVSVFTGYTGATETALAGKVGLDVYTAYTGSTATALAGKQATLVSGTNIKTINNQSILGEGNITIEGGGGGGGTVDTEMSSSSTNAVQNKVIKEYVDGRVVEVTKAQYEALVSGDNVEPDVTYVITDADVVDLNDYAPASGLTELSGTVATINSNYATKQNVTARASNVWFMPGWNDQGVITGGTQIYNKTQGINGSNYNVFSNGNTNHPSIYAPTSAGTAGQPLLSNGSGAPVWGTYKFAFITQTAYDALTTKDSTTIYFITGD